MRKVGRGKPEVIKPAAMMKTWKSSVFHSVGRRKVSSATYISVLKALKTEANCAGWGTKDHLSIHDHIPATGCCGTAPAPLYTVGNTQVA